MLDPDGDFFKRAFDCLRKSPFVHNADSIVSEFWLQRYFKDCDCLGYVDAFGSGAEHECGGCFVSGCFWGGCWGVGCWIGLEA